MGEIYQINYPFSPLVRQKPEVISSFTLKRLLPWAISQPKAKQDVAYGNYGNVID